MSDSIVKLRADYGPRLLSLETALGLTGSIPAPAGRDTLAKVRADFGPRITAIEDAMVKWCCQKTLKPVTSPAPAAPATAEGPPPSGPVVVVSDTAGLLAALAACAGGETIKCGPGTYSGIGAIEDRMFATPVTIAASGVGGAVFESFNISRCQGLRFQGLELSASQTGSYGYRMTGCDGVWFTGCTCASPAGTARGDMSIGLLFTDCRNSRVSGCRFTDLYAAVSAGLCDGLVLSLNGLKGLISDGFDFADSSNVTVANNYVTDITIGVGDHPDGVQSFTSSRAISNIVISGNVILRGAGNVDPQGVFLSAAGEAFGYSNVTIADNFLAGCATNGIVIGGNSAGVRSTNVSITDNQVYSQGSNSRIAVDNVDGVVLANNIAKVVNHNVGCTLDTETGTVSAGTDVVDGGAAKLAAWLTTHPEMAWILTV